MSDRLRPQHLQRQAIVYIRQSSPGQVKNHPESYRVQKGLVARAVVLGWSEDKIRVVQGDQGTSASLPGNRQGFDEVLQSVQSKQVGIVLGQDASRLARNSLDWALMTHWFALHGCCWAIRPRCWIRPCRKTAWCWEFKGRWRCMKSIPSGSG